MEEISSDILHPTFSKDFNNLSIQARLFGTRVLPKLYSFGGISLYDENRRALSTADLDTGKSPELGAGLTAESM